MCMITYRNQRVYFRRYTFNDPFTHNVATFFLGVIMHTMHSSVANNPHYIQSSQLSPLMQVLETINFINLHNHPRHHSLRVVQTHHTTFLHKFVNNRLCSNNCYLIYSLAYSSYILFLKLNTINDANCQLTLEYARTRFREKNN